MCNGRHIIALIYKGLHEIEPGCVLYSLEVEFTGDQKTTGINKAGTMATSMDIVMSTGIFMRSPPPDK